MFIGKLGQYYAGEKSYEPQRHSMISLSFTPPCSKIMSAAKVQGGGTLGEKGERGVWQMLVFADKGGKGGVRLMLTTLAKRPKNEKIYSCL